MDTRHRFAKWTFVAAGIYGILVILPQYFLENQISRDYPPAITHPEHFYGFVGVALAWQFAFFLIASDVKRFRPFMLVAAFEKVTFGVAALVLYDQGRVPGVLAGFGGVDLLLCALFLVSHRLTRDA